MNNSVEPQRMLFENDSYPLCAAREKESERRGWLSHFSHDLIPAALSKDRTMQGGFFSFFIIIIPHLSGQYLKWHGCVIGEGPITVVETRRGCRSVDQSNIEVWLRIGGDIEEGGARSGSVSRLISRCHSATVGC